MICNLCENENLKLFYKGNIDEENLDRFAQYAYYGDIYRCPDCGLVSQKQSHNIQTIIDLLSEEKYLNENIGIFNLNEKQTQFQKHIKYMKKYSEITESHILDIGANTGVFLKECEKYTKKIQGIEPSKEAADYCKTQNLFVQNTVIENADLPDNAFDIITMWDVVEHLYDPSYDLKRVLSKLKPGGRIFITTHDIDGLFAKAMGKNYPMLMYQHFYHFSKKTMKMMLEKTGYKYIDVIYFYKSWSLGYLHELLAKLWPNNLLARMISFLFKPIIKVKWLSSMQIYLPVKNFFMIIAERPDV